MRALRRTGHYQTLSPYWFLAPAVVLLALLSVYPLVYVLDTAFHRLTPRGELWVGGANFLRLLRDPFFLRATLQTVVFATAALAVELGLGLTLALLLDSKLRGRSLWRALFLLPMILPPVVAGVIWRLIYNPNFGALNGAIAATGLDTRRLTWLADPRVAL